MKSFRPVKPNNIFKKITIKTQEQEQEQFKLFFDFRKIYGVG